MKNLKSGFVAEYQGTPEEPALIVKVAKGSYHQAALLCRAVAESEETNAYYRLIVESNKEGSIHRFTLTQPLPSRERYPQYSLPWWEGVRGRGNQSGRVG